MLHLRNASMAHYFFKYRYVYCYPSGVHTLCMYDVCYHEHTCTVPVLCGV